MNPNRPIVGFAGWWEGMTPEQLAAFAAWLVSVDPSEFRCGGCVGSDQQAAEVACRQTRAKLIVHRQPIAVIESPLLLAVASEVIPSSPEDGTQNAPLVKASDIIALAPPGRGHARGGTWRTFKFARWLNRQGTPKPIMLFWPDGTFEEWSEPVQQVAEAQPTAAEVAPVTPTPPIAATAPTKPTAPISKSTPRRVATSAAAKPRKAKAAG